MPEHVLLPIQKFKELVDYTKRVNDIITGFIKRKPKNENSETTAIQPKARKRKAESIPKAEPAKKKSKSIDSAHETKPKASITDSTKLTPNNTYTTPPTPEPSDASSYESEEDAF